MSTYQVLDLFMLLATLAVLWRTLGWVKEYTKAARDQARHADETARAAVDAAVAAQRQVEVSQQQTGHFEATAKAAVEQAEAAQKPCVSAQWRMGGEWVFGNGRLVLSNIGNGRALGLCYSIATRDKLPEKILDSSEDVLIERGRFHETRLTNTYGSKFSNPLVDVNLQDYFTVPLLVKATYRSMSGTIYESRVVLEDLNAFWFIAEFDFGRAPLPET